MKIRLVGSNKCPVCGKEYQAEGKLIPNRKDINKEGTIDSATFYGGRIAFFKDVECDCTAKYKLLIERGLIGDQVQTKVIDMIIEQDGIPLSELARKKEEEVMMKAEAEVLEAMHETYLETGKLGTVGQREEIRRQAVLATVLDKDTKIRTLKMYTIKELQKLCKTKKVKFSKRDTKTELAEKLLASDPSMVVAPEGDTI